MYDHLLKNYGVSGENIIVHIQNDIITIEWSPQEKDEYFDAQFQRSLRLLTDGKLEEARFIMEDLAFRSPDDPNFLNIWREIRFKYPFLPDTSRTQPGHPPY